jgi:hypothetical protein
MEAYESGGGWVPAVQDAGWGRRPEPPPPLRLDWLDYFGCFFIVYTICVTAVHFRGFLLDDEYSVVNVLALILTRMHMLVMKSSPAPSSRTALALLPTCPAPAISTPPVCYGMLALRSDLSTSFSTSPSSSSDLTPTCISVRVFLLRMFVMDPIWIETREAAAGLLHRQLQLDAFTQNKMI